MIPTSSPSLTASDTPRSASTAAVPAPYRRVSPVAVTALPLLVGGPGDGFAHAAFITGSSAGASVPGRAPG